MDPDRLLHISFIFCCLVWWLVQYIASARAPLGVFCLTKALLPPSHPHHPFTLHKHHSWYYSCANKSLPKSSMTNYPRWLGLKLYFQCKPHASTANYGQVITCEFLKLTILEILKVHRWLIFPNPVTYVTQHEKTGLTCTKYTCLYFSGYLPFWIRYSRSVSFIRFSMLFCLSGTNCM